MLVPATVLTLYGATVSPSTNMAGQFYGLSLISIGLITWFARDVKDPNTQRAIVLSQLISTIIGVIVSALNTISGVMSAVGWSGFVIYLVLAFGYGYFQFAKPSAS
ncbi:MAG: hypothetical protein MUO76_10390 [Anaerolineaceae bacterium]|nr:hypothetical protein [Anaerolineaceae bacterium]